MSIWRFEFTLDTPQSLSNVRIPNRMNIEVQETWTKRGIGDGVLRLNRDTEKKLYTVRFKHVFTGPGKFKNLLGKGWSEFVIANNLVLEDRILLVLQDDDGMLYRVRIWRDNKEITVAEPHVVIENYGPESDVESTEYVPFEVLFKPPYFEFTFTKGYMDKPRINILLPFACAHFRDLEEETPVELYVSQWWTATMRIYYDMNKNIIACTIKKGVSKMIAGEGVELGERAYVELEGMGPPVLSITFT